MKVEVSKNITNTSSDGTFKVKQSAHMFKILSESLYNYKEKAVVRELISNAIDSGTDKVEITTPDLMTNNNTFKVKDYGKGMTKDELVLLYSTYGETTKNQTNDFIGGFGIGSKSPFAITKSFIVTSVKDGVKTSILNFIDNNVPSYKILSHKSTDEPNGTEIVVPIEGSELVDNVTEEVKYYKSFRPVDIIIDDELFIKNVEFKDDYVRLTLEEGVYEPTYFVPNKLNNYRNRYQNPHLVERVPSKRFISLLFDIVNVFKDIDVNIDLNNRQLKDSFNIFKKEIRRLQECVVYSHGYFYSIAHILNHFLLEESNKNNLIYFKKYMTVLQRIKDKLDDLDVGELSSLTSNKLNFVSNIILMENINTDKKDANTHQILYPKIDLVLHPSRETIEYTAENYYKILQYIEHIIVSGINSTKRFIDTIKNTNDNPLFIEHYLKPNKNSTIADQPNVRESFINAIKENVVIVNDLLEKGEYKDVTSELVHNNILLTISSILDNRTDYVYTSKFVDRYNDISINKRTLLTYTILNEALLHLYTDTMYPTAQHLNIVANSKHAVLLSGFIYRWSRSTEMKVIREVIDELSEKVLGYGVTASFLEWVVAGVQVKLSRDGIRLNKTVTTHQPLFLLKDLVNMAYMDLLKDEYMPTNAKNIITIENFNTGTSVKPTLRQLDKILSNGSTVRLNLKQSNPNSIYNRAKVLMLELFKDSHIDDYSGYIDRLHTLFNDKDKLYDHVKNHNTFIPFVFMYRCKQLEHVNDLFELEEGFKDVNVISTKEEVSKFIETCWDKVNADTLKSSTESKGKPVRKKETVLQKYREYLNNFAVYNKETGDTAFDKVSSHYYADSAIMSVYDYDTDTYAILDNSSKAKTFIKNYLINNQHKNIIYVRTDYASTMLRPLIGASNYSDADKLYDFIKNFSIREMFDAVLGLTSSIHKQNLDNVVFVFVHLNVAATDMFIRAAQLNTQEYSHIQCIEIKNICEDICCSDMFRPDTAVNGIFEYLDSAAAIKSYLLDMLYVINRLTVSLENEKFIKGLVTDNKVTTLRRNYFKAIKKNEHYVRYIASVLFTVDTTTLGKAKLDVKQLTEMYTYMYLFNYIQYVLNNKTYCKHIDKNNTNRFVSTAKLELQYVDFFGAMKPYIDEEKPKYREQSSISIDFDKDIVHTVHTKLYNFLNKVVLGTDTDTVYDHISYKHLIKAYKVTNKKALDTVADFIQSLEPKE